MVQELTSAMPDIFLKAISVDQKETKNVYECPAYKSKSRTTTHVWTFNLKIKKSGKWVLAGIALLLAVSY